MKRLLLIPALLAALSLAGTADAAAPLTQQTTLTAADAPEFDLFGNGLAVSSDTLVTVSPSHNNGLNATTGVVYVFEKTASGWAHAQQTGELILPAGAGVPIAAAISGDTIAVAAPDNRVGGAAEELAREVTLMGTYDEAREAIGAWFAAGADSVHLVLPPDRPEAELSALVEVVADAAREGALASMPAAA